MRNLFFTILLLSFGISSILAQIQTDIEWPTLANSDWPMIKHDPQFTGRSPYKGPQSPTIIWTVDMPDGIFSGPVIGEGGNLYFGSYYQLDSADHFYAYAPDGNLRWDYKSGTNRPPQSGVLIDSSNTIYFGSLDKYFYALNFDGSLKWKYETSAPIVEISMPNIDLEGRLYITNGLGELYSLNPDGTLNWNVKYENGFIGKSPVFSPDGNTIYIAGKDSNLFALNLDGSIKWKYECAKVMRAPLVDSNGNIFILPVQIPFYLYSIDPSGNIRWDYKFLNLGSMESYSIPTIDKMGNIYVIAIDSSVFPNRALISLDYGGNYRWSYIFEDPSDDFWQPLICDSEGTVYVGSTFGYYYYAIASDGQLKWKLPLNDYQVDNTGAISKDGTLYLGVHKSSLSHNNEKNLIAIWDTTTTGINDEIKVVADYSLFQNYPNPFNPSTKIIWQSPVGSWQTLKVYDILGREIMTLVNEYKPAGKYEVNWNATNLPSGVYIYTLQLNGYTNSKKMLLLK
jgi:hypothetical protein